MFYVFHVFSRVLQSAVGREAGQATQPSLCPEGEVAACLALAVLFVLWPALYMSRAVFRILLLSHMNKVPINNENMNEELAFCLEQVPVLIMTMVEACCSRSSSLPRPLVSFLLFFFCFLVVFSLF